MTGATIETTVTERILVTACVMMATIMQALDTTIANVALPYMQGSLSATLDQVSWVLTSYIVAAAIMTAPAGWLAVRFGRKRIFIISAAGFTVASILCGVAQGINDMVAYRLLQGIFGAALVPLSQAVMLDIYPPEKRGQAMAIWGMGVMLGPILQVALNLRNGAEIVGLAAGGTGAIFLTLAGIATTTKKDFSFLGKFLMVGIVLLILASLANIFFQIPALALTLSAVAILLFSGFLLYDVSRVVNGGETNYVMATLAIYLDIYNIFVNLLQLLMAFMGERD